MFASAAALLLGAGAAQAATLAVGPGKAYATPCRAFAVAKAGDIIDITGNTTYSGDVCAINASNLLIRGVNGRPRIDAAGKNYGGKAIWVVVGSNVVIENVEMYGAKVADRNGAALRLEGTGFTLRKSFIHDNEHGILSGVNTNSDITIESSEFARNGAVDRMGHNVYIGTARKLVFKYNYSHDAINGHNLKSRALTNQVLYNRFSSTPAGQVGSYKPSYEINLPDAGNSYVIGNVIQQPALNSNSIILSYGEESAKNGGKLHVVNNTFLNENSTYGTFVRVGAAVTTPSLIQNNIFGGTGTLTTQASAVLKTNYRAMTPGFVNRAAYDLRPTDALVKNLASAPGYSATGFALAPVAEYVHPAWGRTRVNVGALDIGAYEAAY
jgi:hypothetical protein